MAITALILSSLILAPFAGLSPLSSSVACPRRGDAVAVTTRDHALWLCDKGRPVAMIRVDLGRGGVGKREKGDARTPLGSYSLGTPRPSQRFGTFIPIGYPTPQQTARGLSGGNVGIHGPDRRTATLGGSSRIDWTLGCIATVNDDDLALITAFVQERRPLIVIY